MNDLSTKTKAKELGGLKDKLNALKLSSSMGKCIVCNHMKNMDKDTCDSFIEVMLSKVSLPAISEALVSEGFPVSRTTLGTVRNKCFGNLKDSQCPGLIEVKNGK